MSDTQPVVSDLPTTVALWRDQIERLSEHASLCRYLAPAKWKAMRENALAFLNQHGGEAHRLGWTAPELFGAHPSSGMLRMDSCGVLMLGSGAAQAVHADRVAFPQTSGYRPLKAQASGVPV